MGVRVTTAASTGEAETIAAMLRSCGIDATAQSRRAGARAVAVFVKAEDLDLATAILAAPSTGDAVT